MGYLHYCMDHEELLAVEVLLGHEKITELITALKAGQESLRNIIPFLPQTLIDELSSPAFIEQCMQDFNVLDTSGRGVLGPSELLPLILSLTEAHHYSLTAEHCMYFIDVFDVDGNQVICSEEFVNLVRFMLVMSFMDTAEGQLVTRDA